MQKRRRSSSQPFRRVIAILLIAAGGTAQGQTPSPELELAPPAAAPLAEAVAPGESTLELRVARRPWLLEKLTKPQPEPSIKMNPPRPPADLPDPPSMSQPIMTLPINPLEDDGWLPRGKPKDAAPRRETDKPETKPETKADSLTLDAATSSPERSAASDKTEQEPSTAKSDVDRTEAEAKSQQGRAKSTVPITSAPELNLDQQSDQAPGERAGAGDTKNKASQSSDSSASRFVGSETEPQPPAVRLDYTGYPMQPLKLNRTVRGMQASIRRCLQYYYARPEVAAGRSNWGMLHSIMVYGADTKVIVGRETYSAIAWIAGNNACRGQRLLVEGPLGIEARSGVGLQGHQAQMLAVLSLCDVPMDYPLYAATQRYSVRDIVLAEMAACKRGEELTFTLIGLSHYLDTDQAWISADGQRWDFQRLIREELSQPIVGAACGGTHRLMGFAHALRKRRAEGKPIVGQWKRAEMFTKDFVSYCYRLQNRDGSMSTDWFEGREDNEDLDRKIQTTGHMVEWLLTVTPDSQLQNPRLVSAIRFLLRSMYGERDHEWKIGPKGHALRSLAMYYERVYRSGPAWRTQSMAQQEDWLRR